MQTGPVNTFVPDEVSVRVEPMLRIQGYKDPSRVRPAILRTARAMAEQALHTFEPRACYRTIGIRECRDDGLLIVHGGVAFRSGAFPSMLAGCRNALVFVLTLGHGFDRTVHESQANGEMLEALFLETAGWLGVESVTRSLVVCLRELAARDGLRITRRLSPGYSFKLGHETTQWPLSDQIALFSLFENATLPVVVLESSAMVPKMSRSGLHGLRPAPGSAVSEES